jgi:hypothetical protein
LVQPGTLVEKRPDHGGGFCRYGCLGVRALVQRNAQVRRRRVMKPTVSGGGGFSIVIGWTYGPVLAMAAAIVSGGIAIAASRNQPVTSPSWR